MNKNSTHQLSHSLPIGMLAVLWLVGWTLRVPILAAPPLATRIADTFGLGEAGVGALTMLPVVAVAFGAIPAAWIIARFSLRIVIVGGLLVMVAASVARGLVPTTTTLFMVSIVMGLGVAVFQTALPVATRVWTPTHVALGSAVYLNGMMFGELSGAGLTLPLVLPLAGGDWSLSLILWAIPILLIAALVALVRLPTEFSDNKDIELTCLSPKKSLPSWKDGRVWQYGLLLASSVVAFLAINAYSGTLLRARGETEALGGLLFAYNTMPLLASFIVLAAPKWIGLRMPIAVSAVLSAAGMAGFVFLDSWASWAAALVTGCASTVELILLVSLPPAIAKGIAVTRLSAGMTLIGFSLTFALTLTGGWFADITGWIEMSLIPSLIFMIVALAALGRTPGYPDYE
ncbi:MFS transporter [Gammaproteobacteria bacterium]|nr:MFS transporter [Gammaproteobacteria bacterium]